MKIIVTGSLGHMSKPLAEKLIKQGHHVTVVSSSQERQKEIEELGATAAIGSLEDSDFVSITFEGADAVYCMIPPNVVPTDQVAYYKQIGNNYRSAIEKTGIKRVVHLSSWGAHLSEGTGMIIGSHQVEEILNSLENVEVTHLRAVSLMYNLYSFTGMIKNASQMAANYGADDKIAWVHPNDVATIAAEELLKTDDIEKIKYVASDEMTANQSAKIIGEAIGIPELKWNLISDEAQKKKLMSYGVPEHIANAVRDLYQSIHTGKLAENYEKNKPEMSPTKLKDFAKEFAAVYNKK